MRGRLIWVVVLVALLSGTVGCSTASVPSSSTQTAASPTSTKSKPRPSSTPAGKASDVAVTSVPGYTYGPPPAGLSKSMKALDALGMFASITTRGVKDSSGTEVGAIILMKYNPKLAVLLDTKDPSAILDGAAKGGKANIPGRSTITTRELFGHPVRLIEGKGMSMVIAYKHGGVLIQAAGPTTLPVLRFAGAYLATDR